MSSRRFGYFIHIPPQENEIVGQVTFHGERVTRLSILGRHRPVDSFTHHLNNSTISIKNNLTIRTVKIHNYVVADCFEDVKPKHETLDIPMLMLEENVTPEEPEDDNRRRKRRKRKESLSEYTKF